MNIIITFELVTLSLLRYTQQRISNETNRTRVSKMICGDEVQVPAHLNFGKFILRRLRNAKPDHICLVKANSEEQMTYMELTQYTVRLAASLVELGVKRGDCVGIGSELRLTFVPTGLAVVFAGAAYTPFDLEVGRAILKHQLSMTKLKYFICSSSFWKTYGDILNNLEHVKSFICFDENKDIKLSIRTLIARQSDADVASFEPVAVQGQTDTALILYSSGTTGMPKGVQLTHLNCILNSLPEDFKDKCLQTALIYGAWYHNYDIFTTYKFLSAGRKIVFANTIILHDILRTVQDYKVNIIMTVPAIINLLSKADEVEKYDLSSLKIIYSRSAPLHGKTIEAIKNRIPTLKNVLQGYGMTESGELTSESWGTKGPKIGSVGMASPGISLKIVHPQTREILGPKQSGEICLRGPVFMKGYIDVDPSTYLDDQGFFLTGDLGYYDEDNYLYIVDRLKEIISYHGIKIAPLELETILQLHPGVREAGVVGRPVGTLSEEPAAFVVRQPGVAVSELELQQFVAAEVSPYMQLRGGVHFVPELPRNPRGKILRRRLREMLPSSESRS